MNCIRSTTQTGKPGGYHPDRGLVDYILGITFEIWEERRIERIHEYYSANAEVFGLGRFIRGADGMVAGTRSMLGAFPDRLLLADDVIWSGSAEQGYYSSHRIISPMTNTGRSVYGPATGKRVRVLTIADCIVEDGQIVREYLFRDEYSLVRQLGFDPVGAARQGAGARDAECVRWIQAEIARLRQAGPAADESPLQSPGDDAGGFARRVLEGHWSDDGNRLVNQAYAAYARMYRSPVELYSGRDSIAAHYRGLREAFRVHGVSVDHVVRQPADRDGLRIAVRWTVAGIQTGEYLGISPTGRPVFVLGSTHWRIVDGRIAMEWTVFDQLGVMSQLV